MVAILSVTTSEGEIFFHTRVGLVSYNERDKATKFKTLDLAIKLARKKYKITNTPGGIRGWNAQTIEG